MARVYNGATVWLETPLGWLEVLIYRLCGVNEMQGMSWRGYMGAVLMLGICSILCLMALFMGQGVLPLNPQGFQGLPLDTAFNAAVSFVTNTNWQNYGGETTLSYLSQMAGCGVQNFLSAATGMAVAVALFRGLARKKTQDIGNAYVDVVRGAMYILLPLALLFSLVLASQGVIQNLHDYTEYKSFESEQVMQIAQGPVASQVAIKMLGSNGGGFFNTNAAHPFENPTPLSNLLQIASILLIPAALVYCFGVMVGDRRQSWTLLAAMTIVFVPLSFTSIYFEKQGNPLLPHDLIDQSVGNMEGKETRIGVINSAMWAVATTATSNGSVNSMHDSYTPLAGLISLFFIQFGEVIFGGVGSGAYGMLVYVVFTVFIGGLMVGRTPEYLGKKFGALEIKMASLCILVPALMVLLGSALAISTPQGVAGVFNPGAQGFSEVLYALSSASNNNGSAFAGMHVNTPFYNVLLAVAMLAGRYGIFLPVLIMAGALAEKNKVPAGSGTLPTHTPLFVAMLVGSILLLDVLTYVPALALGPIAEYVHLYHHIGGVQ